MTGSRPPGEFGTRLREARERKGIPLRQIANVTKISMTVLEALERNDVSRLPGGIFSRAFVRSYAVEVGLDPEATIQDFVAQFPQEAAAAGRAGLDAAEGAGEVETGRRIVGTLAWILIVTIPIAGALLYYTRSETRLEQSADALSAAAPPASPRAPSQDGSEPDAAGVLPPGTIRATPVKDVAAVSASQAAPSPRPMAADGPAAFTVPPPARAATPAKGEPSPPSSPVSAASTPEAGATAPAAAPGARARSADRLSVVLSARRPVWVSATVDGQRSIDRMLGVGERQTIEVRHEIVLTAGDGSALALTLNGSEARVLGKAGEAVTVRVNLNNFQEYLQIR
jgi:cytoskeletal protein RodZ